MNLESFLVRLAGLFLAFPLAASATIYKWTDEHGTTVYSNRAPAAEAKVSNMQVALEDDKPAVAARPDSGNDLQGRIRALEQQVQAMQSQPSAQGPNYAAPPPPTSYYPPPDYYPPQSYPTDYSSMYGNGYPYYPYPYPSYIVVTGRRFVRPVHPIHHGFVGQRVGVRPMPVASAMGATRAMGGAHRR